MIPSSIRKRIEHRPDLLKILDNIGWLVLDKILRMGIGLFVGVWLARHLGPEQFGQFNYAIAFVGLFAAIAGLGLNGIVVRDIVWHPKSANITLSTAFILQGLAGLLSVLLTIFTISILKPDDDFTQKMIIILSPTLIFKAADTIRCWYEAHVQTRQIIWIENTALITMAAIRVAMIINDATLISFVWINLAEAALISTGVIVLYTRNNNLSGLFKAKISCAKSLANDCWPLFLAAISVTLYMRIDTIMLEEISGSREVGIYVAATRISEVWHFIPMAIVSSIAPSLIKKFNEDKTSYLSSLRRLYFMMFWSSIAGAVLIFALSESIISILFGPEFNGAAPVLSIHLWSSIAVFLGVASSQYLLIEGMQKYSLYRTLIGLCTNIILNLLLIPKLGAVGASISTVLSYFSATFSLVFFKATRAHSIYLFMSPFHRNKDQ
jgi:PST family polysaccharide transporter